MLDTSVLVAAWRSRNGASHAVLSHLHSGDFEIAVSVPLVIEYEAVLLRHTRGRGLAAADVHTLVDYLCGVARKQAIFFLWRPFLRDAGDDMLVDLAVAAQCHGIVTHNLRDFAGVERMGLEAYSPADFLMRIGGRR